MSQAMSFELKWLTDHERTLHKVEVTNWVVDEKRDIAMWTKGKHWQVRAEGDCSESVFLRIAGREFYFELQPSPSFRTYESEGVHHYVWDRLLSYYPNDMNGMKYAEVIAILKEALSVEGGGSHSNIRHPHFDVSFNF
jgi:hypothetical protein